MKLIASRCATVMFNSVYEYINDNYDKANDDTSFIIKADQFLAPDGADKVVKNWFYQSAINVLCNCSNLVFEIEEQESEFVVSCQNAQIIDEFVETLNTMYKNRLFGNTNLADDKDAVLKVASTLAWPNKLCPLDGANGIREWLYDFAKNQYGLIKLLSDKGLDLPLDSQKTIILS